jgi:hypothetical protein
MSAATTIAVAPGTKSRLEALKVPGLTFDDVINFALDRLDPKEVKALYEAWQEQAFKTLMSSRRVRKAKG